MENNNANSGEVKFESQEAQGMSFRTGTERAAGVNEDRAYEYFLVVDGEAMHCSCGRELNKLVDGTYKCSGGFPIYRPDNGEVMKDKNGDIWLKVLPHVSENQ